jgi:hypothetical protein
MARSGPGIAAIAASTVLSPSAFFPAFLGVLCATLFAFFIYYFSPFTRMAQTPFLSVVFATILEYGNAGDIFSADAVTSKRSLAMA